MNMTYFYIMVGNTLEPIGIEIGPGFATERAADYNLSQGRVGWLAVQDRSVVFFVYSGFLHE